MPKIDLKKAAQEAEKRKNIIPKLEFGEENREGRYVVRFEDDSFTEAINPKPLPGMKPEFLTIPVTVVTNDGLPQAPGGPFQLAGSPGSTLGDGLLKVWNKHDGKLKGVHVEIRAVYTLIKKINKKARVYNVTEVAAPAATENASQ